MNPPLTAAARLEASPTLRINERSDALRAAGREVIKLGLGQSPFPVPAPVVATLAANAHQKDYLPVQGLPALREAVAAFHRETDGAAVEATDTLIGPGSKELLFLLQLAFDGDVLVPSPCWVSYAPQARIAGRPLRVLDTTFAERWRLTPERLDAHCRGEGSRPRLLILNSPGNPDGLSYAAAELADLAAVARRHGVVVLSDEIYGGLHHHGAHVSLSRYYAEGTIISGGLSKWCGAGGWRLGTFAFPRRLTHLREAMAALASETFTSVSAPIQHAAVVAFQRPPEVRRYLAASRRIAGALGRFGADLLASAGARIHPPTGAFYLFADLSPLRPDLARRGVHTGADLCERLLADTGVATLPGECFLRPPEELTVRVATVDFDGAAALAALGDEPHLTEAHLDAWCAPTVTGLRRLASWLSRRRS